MNYIKPGKWKKLLNVSMAAFNYYGQNLYLFQTKVMIIFFYFSVDFSVKTEKGWFYNIVQIN